MAVNAAAKADKSLPAATRKAAQAGQERFYDALTSFIVDWPQRPDSAYIVLRWARE